MAAIRRIRYHVWLYILEVGAVFVQMLAHRPLLNFATHWFSCVCICLFKFGLVVFTEFVSGVPRAVVKRLSVAFYAGEPQK